METARLSLTDAGQCAEAYWPYDPRRDCAAPGYGPSADAVVDAAVRRVPRHRIVVSPSVQMIKEAAASADAVVLGVDYHRSARDIGSDGRIPIPGAAEPSLGGHAYLVAGYDDDTEALLLRNSWGPTWGDGGYGWMPYAFPDIFLREMWVFGLH
jgi:hypothetical protein